MCLDPLGRAQLLVKESIQLVDELAEAHAAHDPGVVEAVRARLRDAEVDLREVQAGFWRKEAWRVTRDVIREVAVILIELLIRASTTSCNFSYSLYLSNIHANRFYDPPVSAREWLITIGARSARRGLTFVPLAGRARPARAYAERAPAIRRAPQRAVRRAARRGPRRCYAGPQVADRDGQAH